MTQPHGRAIIDLGALKHNVAVIKQRVGDRAVLAVVKADAYGHGLVPCAKAALDGGATWLGVALLEEAITLRDSGISAPILTWLNTVDDQFADCIDRNIDLGVNSVESARSINAAAHSVNKTARVHIKVDTGLGRNGVRLTDLPALLAELSALENIRVVGAMSHFASADDPLNPSITAQIAEFISAINLIEAAGIELEVKHLANSAATLSVPDSHFNMVRAGIIIYGITPGSDIREYNDAGLKPVMTLKGAVALLKDVPANAGVSYSHKYFTSAPTRLALIPLGYADGIPRAASSEGPVLVDDTIVKVAGRVCMDQFVLDVADLRVSVGDEVTLFGDPNNGAPSVEDWAKAANTIGYEIVTRIGPRVPREYING